MPCQSEETRGKFNPDGGEGARKLSPESPAYKILSVPPTYDRAACPHARARDSSCPLTGPSVIRRSSHGAAQPPRQLYRSAGGEPAVPADQDGALPRAAAQLGPHGPRTAVVRAALAVFLGDRSMLMPKTMGACHRSLPLRATGQGTLQEQMLKRKQENQGKRAKAKRARDQEPDAGAADVGDADEGSGGEPSDAADDASGEAADDAAADPASRAPVQ